MSDAYGATDNELRGDAAATAADTRPDPAEYRPMTDREYVAAVKRDANTDGTLTNYVMYGADRDLTAAQEAFTRGDVTGGISALRYVADTVKANRSGLTDLMSGRGLDPFVDNIVALSAGMLQGAYLDVPINIDGAEYSARELLYSPDGMKAVRRHHLESDLRLDPKFVADYLDDNTDATKREAMGIIVDNITQPIQVTTPSGVKTISPESSSEQARDYATAFMDLWDDRENADGSTTPGLSTVFGTGSAELVTSLIKSSQNRTIAPSLLRSLTTIYGGDIREGETGYARARRAVSDFMALKDMVMKKDAVERLPNGLLIQSEKGDGREELFSAIVNGLAEVKRPAGMTLDLGSSRTKTAFKALFDTYDEAKARGQDLDYMYSAANAGSFSNDAAKFLVQAATDNGQSVDDAMISSDTLVGGYRRYNRVMDLHLMGSRRVKDVDALNVADSREYRKVLAAKSADTEMSPACAGLAEDFRSAFDSVLLPESLKRNMGPLDILREEAQKSADNGVPTELMKRLRGRISNRMSPYFPVGTASAIADTIASKGLARLAGQDASGEALVPNDAYLVMSELMLDAVQTPTDFKDESARAALTRWVRTNVARAELWSGDMNRLISHAMTMNGESRDAARAYAENIISIADSARTIEEGKRIVDDQLSRAVSISIDDAGVVRVDRDKTVDANEIKSDPTKLFMRQRAIRQLPRQQSQLRSQQIRFQDAAAAAEAERTGGVPPTPPTLTSRPPTISGQPLGYRF